MAKVALVKLKPGKLVSYQGKVHRIRRVNSLENVELLDDANQAVLVTKVDELQPAEQSNEQTHTDLQAIGEASWAVAQKRYDIIKPLLDKPDRTRADVATQAAIHSVHTNTVYGWLRAYEQSGLRSSLLPKTSNNVARPLPSVPTASCVSQVRAWQSQLAGSKFYGPLLALQYVAKRSFTRAGR